MTPDAPGSERTAAVRPRRSIGHERKLYLLALASGAPGVLLSAILLWAGEFEDRTRWTLLGLVVLLWLVLASAVREKAAYSLRTLSNLLAALREGDYSLRVRPGNPNDAFAEVVEEVNLLGQTLKEQRLGEIEAATLLAKVMEEIDVAVFAFDGQGRLRLVNRAGERLLGRPAETLTGRSAEALGLAECLALGPSSTIERAFPCGSGRWGVRLGSFRESGRPHRLLVLSDLTRELREEELKAWQRLVRVLGHELNNSLAPIRSIAGSLASLLRADPLPADWRQDMQDGLRVIGGRAESLARFMAAYTRLARLPEPQLRPLEVGACIRRVAGLETRLPVRVEPGPAIAIRADADQLEQLLINLLNNAVEAALETRGASDSPVPSGRGGGAVTVRWSANGDWLEVAVDDDGPGLSSDANLFVPFFTTKPGGSGIGLVLSRKIAEGHGGTLTLRNRTPGPGCRALLRLPIEAPPSRDRESGVPEPDGAAP